jgi:hypothetical protein
MFSVLKLYPMVNVYRGLTEDPGSIVEALINAPKGDGYATTDWRPWGKERGRQITTNGPLSRWHGQTKSDDIGYEAFMKLNHMFELALGHYLNEYGLELQDPIAPGIAVSIYKTSAELTWHTDGGLKPGELDLAGPKWSITCNVYLNDDYEGGELNFRIGTFFEGTEVPSYKPVAGDLVMFPSNAPFFHASSPVTVGEKCFAGISLQEVLPENVRPTWQVEYLKTLDAQEN